jgi:hypothetical protein
VEKGKTSKKGGKKNAKENRRPEENKKSDEADADVQGQGANGKNDQKKNLKK